MPTLEKQLEHIRRSLLVYKRQWPRRAGIKSLQWIDGNFAAQGYRDNTLIPWRKTKSGKKVKFGIKSQILIQSGRLRRGNRMQEGNDQVRIYNATRYARIHNEGYSGSQSVRAHNRRRKLTGTIEHEGKSYAYGHRVNIASRQRVKNAKVTETIKVKAFVRKMNMPRRQFMPSANRGSRMLNQNIRNMTEQDLRKIYSAYKL